MAGQAGPESVFLIAPSRRCEYPGSHGSPVFFEEWSRLLGMGGVAREWVQGWGGLGTRAEVLRGEKLEPLGRRAILARGLGRAYGDSALPPPGTHDPVLVTTRADRILALDEGSCRLRAEAGLELGQLLSILARRNLFVPVVPGTQFVTLGGMVAADVHGKNHHLAGTFGRHVEALRMLTGQGEVLEASRERHADLFRATLGGMGLTGHILEVACRIERIPSPWILEERRRATNLDELLELLATSARHWPFTVAWLDALARGGQLGRGVVWRGRWAEANEAPAAPPRSGRRIAVPFEFPRGVLREETVRLLNAIQFGMASRTWRRRVVPYEAFFFPLDRVRHWNRIYGPDGLTQFQCVLPAAGCPGAVRRFLELASELGGSSFLCVLKDCGPRGEGILSFPFDGISVALDLPVRPGIEQRVDRLAQATAEEGGRVYLAKDGYLTARRFRQLEPRLDEFLEIRKRYDPAGRIVSAQFVRLMAGGESA